MIGSITFKKFTGENLPDVESYVKEYCSEHQNIEVMVGTDSQNKGTRTVFSTVIAMYDSGDGVHGHGAHCIFRRWHVPVYKREQKTDRLFKEVEESIKVAKSLRNSGIKVKYIDIDVNPKIGSGSYDIYSSARGWVEGEGFECRYKTLGPLVTTLADWLVKG